jgi:diphthamide biosynthesis protein 2
VDGLRAAVEPLQISILYNEIPLGLDPPSSTATDAPLSSTTPILSDANGLTERSPSTILYIGGESLGLTNLLMTHASSQVHSPAEV